MAKKKASTTSKSNAVATGSKKSSAADNSVEQHRIVIDLNGWTLTNDVSRKPATEFILSVKSRDENDTKEYKVRDKDAPNGKLAKSIEAPIRDDSPGQNRYSLINFNAQEPGQNKPDILGVGKLTITIKPK